MATRDPSDRRRPHEDVPTAPRRAAGSIRLDVVATEAADFQVRVFVDDVEMTSRGAGLGMPPSKLFVPENRLVATAESRVVPIARCTCGVYGCGVTDVRIQREDDVVHWDWIGQTPTGHGATFSAARYDAEVARAGADHAWERPTDTAERLILTGTDRTRLADEGVKLRFAELVFDDPSTYRVVLQTTDNRYHVILHFPLRGRSPVDAVDEVLETLGAPPASWSATFHPSRRDVTGPPAMAGENWHR
ncbi:hypothetical protein ACFS27_23815 [Promicromonospora vindobonensis]|uniref:Uncharacterized protein n=1 Tax=Promicromonospora vindobonensis TaxID=195748 RepID=A0ABW5W169_9MICO